jgi:hypothetical protein
MNTTIGLGFFLMFLVNSLNEMSALAHIGILRLC